MKKITIISAVFFASAAIFFITGCKDRTATQNKAVLIDSSGYAEFQAWKESQKEVAPVAANKSAAKNQQVTMSSTSSHEAKVSAKKKGWSKAAKYAVIGGTGGAVLGAVINKKSPVKGAVIGAVVLGGGGYIFGRSKDKQEGRY